MKKLRELKLNTNAVFDYDDDGNVVFYGLPIFAEDENNDIYITENGEVDDFWEIDEDNNVTPLF